MGQQGGGHEAQTPPEDNRGRKPRQQFEGWLVGGLSWAGPQQGNKARTSAPSTQQGKWGRVGEELVLTHSGMCKDYPCPSTELPGSTGAAQLWQTPSNSCLSMVEPTILHGSGAGGSMQHPLPRAPQAS